MKKYAYSLVDLKNLVKSLSGAEKRHFSLLSSTFINADKKPLYLQLFQHLIKEETELSDLDSLPELTTVKKRLFRNILKSLRVFHQDKSVEISIQNCLSDIEILYSLSLPKQSSYLLQRAYEQAVANEKFALLLSLLEWEKKLNMVLDSPSRSIMEIAREERHVLKQLMQLIELENLFSSMKSLKRQYGQVKGGLEKELDEESLNIINRYNSDECISQKAKFYYNFTYAIYNWITYDHKAAYGFSKELLHLEIKAVLPGDYIDSILEHSTSCIQIGKFKEALETLEYAQQMMRQLNLEQVPVLNTKVFFYTVGYHLVIYNYTGNKEQLLYTINRAENEIRHHENNMPIEARQVLTANLMNAYLGIGDIKKVDELWESLFQKTSKSIRRNIYDDLRLFRLFNLLQHKAYAVIPSMALSAYRYYSKPEHNSGDFGLELKLTMMLIKEHDYDNEAVRESVLNSIKETVNEYIKSFNNNSFLEHYTIYAIWIECIITERPFCDAAAMWHENYLNQSIL
jgi:hypothetical protein